MKKRKKLQLQGDLGDNEGIYVLSNARFAIRSYQDLQDKKSREVLIQQNIKLIFLLGNFRRSTKHSQEVQHILKLTKELNANIVLCCAVGENYQGKFVGRSLAATPYGISWQVAATEEDNELLRTVMISHNAMVDAS